MTVASLSPLLKQRFQDNNNNPLANGLLYSYSAGTSTPTATYTDSTGSTPNTNPVVLNARGEADVWVIPNTGYKFTLTDSLGNTIWTEDNVYNSQFIGLYGTDSGAANTYLITYSTPNTTYTNGQIIYFIPANSNTGASTVNVNGWGVVPIVNVNGSALGANQLISGTIASIVYVNGSFQLNSVASFTGSTVGTFGQEVPLASASTVDLGTAPAHVVQITGTTAITSFGSSASLLAPIYIVRFTGSLTLTYNSSSMILPGSASIVTMAGDSAIAEYLGSGNWKVLFYQSSGGQQNSFVKASDTARTSTTTLTNDPDLMSNTLAAGRYAYEMFLVFDAVAAGNGFKFTNGGTAIDSRGVVPSLSEGIVNGTALSSVVGPYGNTISFANVTATANANIALFKGSILVGTPGTFGVSWAQNTSSASATTLRAGSYLTLTLLNTGSAQNQLQRIYSTAGSGTETIPTGYNNLVIEAWGPGGPGGNKYVNGAITSGGGGGASGGYTRTTLSVTTQGGNTLLYTVGAAGATPGGTSTNTTVASGTATITTMTAAAGGTGTAATAANVAGTGGTAGTATGGTAANTPGNAGANGMTNAGGGGGGNPGFGIPGISDGGNPGGRGVGVIAGSNPGAGIVTFTYT